MTQKHIPNLEKLVQCLLCMMFRLESQRRKTVRKDLIKNKIYGMIFIVLGALTVPIEWDVTFFLFALFLAIVLFVARENRIMD